MNKVISVKEEQWNCFFWEGDLWKKIHKQLFLKDLNLLYKTDLLEGAKIAVIKARRWVDTEDLDVNLNSSLEMEALLRFIQKKKIDPQNLAWDQRRKLIFLLLQRGFTKENIDKVLSVDS